MSPSLTLRVGIIWAAACAAATPAAFAQATSAVDESFFAQKLYPILHAAQCVRCHSDNGVASETSLEFPRADAGDEQITALDSHASIEVRIFNPFRYRGHATVLRNTEFVFDRSRQNSNIVLIDLPK
jgi:hypothetical protein